LLTFIAVFSVKLLFLLSKSGCGTRLKFLLSATIRRFSASLFPKSYWLLSRAASTAGNGSSARL
jgi:hypothetical protein